MGKKTLQEMKEFCEKMAMSISALLEGQQAIEDSKNLTANKTRLQSEVAALQKEREELPRIIDEDKKSKYAEIKVLEDSAFKKQAELDELLRTNKIKSDELDRKQSEADNAMESSMETRRIYEAKITELAEKERNVKAAFQTING